MGPFGGMKSYEELEKYHDESKTYEEWNSFLNEQDKPTQSAWLMYCMFMNLDGFEHVWRRATISVRSSTFEKVRNMFL